MSAAERPGTDAADKRLLGGARKVVGRRLWLLAYAFEEHRHLHAGCRHHWREAGCCIALAVLRLVGAA